MKCTDCNQEVLPVVAVDVDGTISDYHFHLIHFIRDYYDLPHEAVIKFDGSEGISEYLGITKDEYRSAKLAYRQGGQKRLQPVLPGVAQMFRVLREWGVEVWVTTTRPYQRFDSTDPDTRFWLDRHGIDYDHLLYDDDKYVRLSEIVDPARVIAVLDDLPDKYDEAESVGLDPILVKNPWNRAVHRPVEAASLNHALMIIKGRMERWNTTK